MASIACQITRNPFNNRIEKVTAENGRDSKLYQDALTYTADAETALNIWTVNYTDKFREITASKKNNALKDGNNILSNQGTEIKYQKAGNNINLDLIETSQEYRGRGYASRAMTSFIKAADQQNSTIRLIVAPRDRQTDTRKLEDFYKSFGFVFDSQFGFPSDFEMIRRPNPSNNTLDNNNEAKLDKVLAYLESERVKEAAPLNTKEVTDIENMMVSFDTDSSDTILNDLKRIFNNGNFSVKALNGSSLFSAAEKARIAEDVDYRNNLLTLKRKLENTEGSIINDKEYREEYVTYSGEVNDYGIDIVDNPLEVENTIVEAVAGVTTREGFDNAFNSIDYPGLVDYYNENQDFANEVFEEYSTLTKLNVFEVEDGQLLETKAPNRVTETENAANLENSNFGEDIRFLSQVPFEIWESSKEDIQDALKSIEEKGVEAAIDLQGLSESYTVKSRAEIIRFLASLNNLENVQTQENMQSFLESYSNFFEVVAEQKQDIEQLSEENRDKTLVKVNQPMSEYEMFDAHSLIKVSDGIYQKVNKTSLERLMNTLNQEVEVNGRYILPQEAYSDLNSYLNKRYADIDLGVDSFNVDVAKQLYLMKSYFNNNIQFETENLLEEYLQKIDNFDGDYTYLSSDYISDFQTQRLKEREKDSEKYRKVYSKFTVTQEGIVPNTLDIKSLKGNINELLNEKEIKNLKNYAIISKNEGMNDLIDVENDSITLTTLQNSRLYYQNNLKQLPNFKGNTENINEGEIVTDIISDSFLRVNNRLYEKAQDVGGQSFFKQIPNFDGIFNMFGNTNQKPVNKFAQEVISSYIAASETNISVRNKYSQKELETINQNQFNCS